MNANGCFWWPHKRRDLLNPYVTTRQLQNLALLVLGLGHGCHVALEREPLVELIILAEGC